MNQSTNNQRSRQVDRPHVVILGGGFGGLYAGRHLARAPVRITIVDRRNHHLFQPLLYEVATAALSPADIAEPIRRVFARQKNTEVLLGEAQSIDTTQQVVHLDHGDLHYDYLIVATGATHSYFGHEDWESKAPGLKSIEDALEIRRRFLLAFEEAEREADPEARKAKLTFVVVGAGPTGVELAGTMSEIARRAIPRDFRSIDTATARIILVEGDDRVLPTLDPDSSRNAQHHLEALGVELRLGQLVSEITDDGVVTSEDEHIAAGSVFWAAGVQGTPIAESLGVELAAGGRVPVGDDLTIEGHRNVFVIGDLASAHDPETGKPVPGVAPAAIQMGKYVARLIRRETAGHGDDESREPFRYKDKGMLATIGRARAVGNVFGMRVSGLMAWLLWAVVHIMSLVGYANRLVVLTRWAWAYFVFQRGARLITGKDDLHLHQPMTTTFEKAGAPTQEKRTTGPANATEHAGASTDTARSS